MSCGNCVTEIKCENEIINLGCTGHCGLVTTDFCIDIAGTYRIEYELYGVIRSVEIVIENDGDRLQIPLDKLPINKNVIFTLWDENNKILNLNGITKIQINTNLKLNSNNMPLANEIIQQCGCFSASKGPYKVFEITVPALNNGQNNIEDWTIQGLTLGGNYNIVLATDVSAFPLLIFDYKLINNDTIKINIVNESGNNNVVLPVLRFNVYKN